MKAKIGINGFGRIGRLDLRAGFNTPELEFVHINEAHGPAATSAHLVEFDTVHGRWDHEISSDSTSLSIDGQRITHSENQTIEQTDWSHCDIVLECSGKFRTPALLENYFEQGVKKVIVAAPVKEGALNIVVGCNDDLYDPELHHLITAASCTTNCIAPVVKTIHESFGIKHGMITTLHDLTNTQTIVDAPHPDLRRARSAVNSLIPTTTGSATAITMIYPELKGLLNGVAVRVPMLNSSLTDCVFELRNQTTVEEVNRTLKEASESSLKGILGVEDRPLVSADYVNDPRSGIVDLQSTMMVNHTQLKLLVWYDNEWGYANRMIELTRKVASLL